MTVQKSAFFQGSKNKPLVLLLIEIQGVYFIYLSGPLLAERDEEREEGEGEEEGAGREPRLTPAAAGPDLLVWSAAGSNATFPEIAWSGVAGRHRIVWVADSTSGTGVPSLMNAEVSGVVTPSVTDAPAVLVPGTTVGTIARACIDWWAFDGTWLVAWYDATSGSKVNAYRLDWNISVAPNSTTGGSSPTLVSARGTGIRLNPTTRSGGSAFSFSPRIAAKRRYRMWLAAIATMSEEAKLYVEMKAKVGRGYVSSERNLEEDDPIGTIPIDAIYSPIKKVSYNL